ncbi:MAG: stage V sporulation protein AC [Firmicutes bacterium]|nr:stage V sporulation protein AC [Bacillota bacterium]
MGVNMDNTFTNQQYQDYVKQKAPKSNIVKNTVLAFIVGGIICMIGQAFSDYMEYRGVAGENIKSALPTIMVALGAFFTGIGLYDKLAKHAGAGTIVPITGFANAVVSPAVEYKPEGHVMGVGAKMFTVAGPVIVFGTIASIVVGFFYYLFG